MEIAITAARSPQWHEARDFARENYRAMYGALTAPEPDLFVTVRESADGPVLACAGLSNAERGAFFSENYLGARVEDALAGLSPDPVRRGEVVEVGPLAGTGGAGKELIRLLPIIAWCQGKRFILATVTDQVRGLMSRLHVPFVPLAPADPAWMDAVERRRWGTYYERTPTAGAVPLDDIGRLINSSTGRYSFGDLVVRTPVPLTEAVAGAHA
ncbi:thermostable hemolysin [Streptomyces pinistramenti]|uniref:thermostable hemolysin n=1 Tax=Streptomyces pinistramenti TaxID=2884812 RepID=UPI001D096CBD|nr:thermostable hemolysin [Streptomyces pinistramenti]MCB5910439.1 thermostable hemolysin [Streptomyces pinistramenti]